MSVFTTPLTPVEAPGLVPYQTGLLISARLVEHGPDDGHWLMGERWKPRSTAVGETFNVFNPPAFVTTQTGPVAGGLNVLRSEVPFAVAVREIDSAIGWGADYIERATDRLTVIETALVERELETAAAVPSNLHLADAGATVLAGGNRVSTKDALSLLDEAIALARCGMGMIHAPAYLAAQWVSLNNLEPVEVPAGVTPTDAQVAAPRKYMSPAGNMIVFGDGYSGIGPDGSGGSGDPLHTFSWCYATDMMVVHRSLDVIVEPPNLDQALDRVNNTIAFRAMRPYGIAWSRLCLSAVKVITATPTV